MPKQANSTPEQAKQMLLKVFDTSLQGAKRGETEEELNQLLGVLNDNELIELAKTISSEMLIKYKNKEGVINSRNLANWAIQSLGTLGARNPTRQEEIVVHLKNLGTFDDPRGIDFFISKAIRAVENANRS